MLWNVSVCSHPVLSMVQGTGVVEERLALCLLQAHVLALRFI